jgi:hypothetical protein
MTKTRQKGWPQVDSFYRVVTKQFAPAVYRSVAVSIQHQQAIIGIHPACAIFNAVYVVVKQNAVV